MFIIYAPVIITSNQFIKLSTFTLEGSGYGIYVDGKSTVQLEGTNKIDIAGFDESYGIAVNGINKVDMGAASNTEIRIDGNPVRWEDM